MAIGVAVDELYRGMTSAQASAARADGYVLALSGAGTGKTKTMVTAAARRILVDGVNPQRLCIVTFTNEAARGMRARLEQSVGAQRVPQAMGTFHAIALRQLRAFPQAAGLGKGFHVVDPDDMKVLASEFLHETQAFGVRDARPSSAEVAEFLEYVSILKSNIVLPENLTGEGGAPVISINPMDRDCTLFPLPEFKVCENLPDVMMASYGPFLDRMSQRNMADFDDLLLWVTVGLRDNEEYRRRMAAEFDAVMVDEFQDVNLLQYEWARLMAQDHGQLLVVGDDGQAIFGWRGADPRYIREFTRRFEGAQMFVLDKNFRSTNHILDCGTAVLAHDTDSLKRDLKSDYGPGKPVEVRGFESSTAEAAYVASMVSRALMNGTPATEIAVLYRTNTMSLKIEMALSQLGITSEVVKSRSIYQRPEVKMAMAFLSVVAFNENFQSDVFASRCINVPARGVGQTSIDGIRDLAASRGIPFLTACRVGLEEGLFKKAAARGISDFLETMAQIRAAVEENKGATVGDVLRTTLHQSGYLPSLSALANPNTARKKTDDSPERAAERLEVLTLLCDIADDFESIEQLHETLTLNSSEKGRDGGVKLMTAHSSKGLEYQNVFLIGMEKGTFPLERRDSGEGDINEECRLGYVALTRAKTDLTVTWCQSRMERTCGPSKFLDWLPKGSIVSRGIPFAGGQSHRTSAHSQFMARPSVRMRAYGG